MQMAIFFKRNFAKPSVKTWYFSVGGEKKKVSLTQEKIM